ncbi:E3 ubiquitin-protein ligase TRIM13-like isoform X2 [Palaemon carinicauda]
MNCLVCTERYRSGEYSPRILPCSHTFCSKCIKKLLHLHKKKNESTTCPFCRREYKAESVADLIVNRDLLEISEKQEDLVRKNPLSYPVWKETVWRDTVEYHLNESRTIKARIDNRIRKNTDTIKVIMDDIVGFKKLIPSLANHFLTWFDWLELALTMTNSILNQRGYLMKTGSSGSNDRDLGVSNKSFEEFTIVTRKPTYAEIHLN